MGNRCSNNLLVVSTLVLARFAHLLIHLLNTAAETDHDPMGMNHEITSETGVFRLQVWPNMGDEINEIVLSFGFCWGYQVFR